MLLQSDLIQDYIRTANVIKTFLGKSAGINSDFEIVFNRIPYLVACLLCCVFALFQILEVSYFVASGRSDGSSGDTIGQTLYVNASVITSISKLICGHCAYLILKHGNLIQRFLRELVKLERRWIQSIEGILILMFKKITLKCKERN